MKHIASLAILFLLVAGTAFGQTGGVTGLVVDPSGAPVEGARVSLWQEGACETHVLTDATGIFNLIDVPEGTYTLKAGKPRVGNVMVEGVEVISGQITDVGQIVLEGTGPHGPGGNKYQYKDQEQHGQD